jgi:uncharacterized membrane protein YkvA (DUF1232 family)
LTAAVVPAENASWLSERHRGYGGRRSFTTLVSHAHLAIRLLREPRVPLLTKAVPLLALLYVVSPIVLVPDILPAIGEIDDLTVILAAVAVFLRLCPSAAVAFHRTAIADGQRYAPMSPTDDVIDAEWRQN